MPRHFPVSPIPQREIDLDVAIERARAAALDLPWSMAAILVVVVAMIGAAV